MKKRILTLLLALLMIVPLSLSSCSQSSTEEEEQVEAERSTLWLTLYAITDSKTTPEAVAQVQEAVNRLTYLRYKTYLQLEFYTEGEYQAALDKAQDKFDKLAEESAALSSSIEASRKKEKAEDKKLSPEELRKKKQAGRLSAKESIRQSKAEYQAYLDRIEQGIEEPPAPVSDPQVDLVFVPSFEKLVEMADKGSLRELDSYLKENYTILGDYIQPAVMTGVKIAGQGTTYAIPTNSAVTPEGSFMLFKKELVDKYNMDLSKIVTLKDVSPLLSTIKANEAGLLPVEKPVTVIAELDYFKGDRNLFAAANLQDTWLAQTGQAETGLSNSVAIAHFELMSSWRQNGYFTTGPAFHEEATYEEMMVPAPEDATADFFMTVKEGSYYDVAAWEEAGYYVVTHRSPEYTTENSLRTFYGISSNSKQADRAMEILRMMTTDAQLKNLLQYGIQDVHYTLNQDGKTVTKLTDDYTMDFYGTGNTFIGYLPAEMGPNYISDALEMSKEAKISAFIGFDPRYDKATMDLYLSLKDLTADYYTQLCNGTPRVIPTLRIAEGLVETELEKHGLNLNQLLMDFNDGTDEVKGLKSGMKDLVLLSDTLNPSRAPEPDFADQVAGSSNAAATSSVAASSAATTSSVAPAAQ